MKSGILYQLNVEYFITRGNLSIDQNKKLLKIDSEVITLTQNYTPQIQFGGIQ